MVAGSLTDEVVSPLPPSRLWKAVVKDGHNLLPKVLPDLISSCDLTQGDAGTIFQYNFTPANKHFSYAKYRRDEVDEEKLVHRYSLIGGGMLGIKLSEARYENKFEGTAEGGTKLTVTSTFQTIADELPSEAAVAELKAAGIAMFKAVEAYLLANPTLYA